MKTTILFTIASLAIASQYGTGYCAPTGKSYNLGNKLRKKLIRLKEFQRDKALYHQYLNNRTKKNKRSINRVHRKLCKSRKFNIIANETEVIKFRFHYCAKSIRHQFN